MKKRKLRIDRIIIASIILVITIFGLIYMLVPKNDNEKTNKMINLTDKNLEEVKKYVKQNNLILEIKEEYSTKEKDKIINQSIAEGSIFIENDRLIITISKGIDYKKLKIDELGNVPIMMYHGIHNIKNNEYIGGNVDKDGYQRTAEAFEKDLGFYYQNDYRMIRLEDYVNGIIDVEAGKSPIILTFDDGLENNIKVIGLDDQGNIIIDPKSAVGILESFKKKYPDFNVTATFFVNAGIFGQSDYNEKILTWLIDNNYDIGNHSYSHADLSSLSKEKVVQEIGSVYNLLNI